MGRTINDLEVLANGFKEKYGELLTLKANIAAINKMLIKRGRIDELYDSLAKVFEDFENKRETPDEQEIK